MWAAEQLSHASYALLVIHSSWTLHFDGSLWSPCMHTGMGPRNTGLWADDNIDSTPSLRAWILRDLSQES